KSEFEENFRRVRELMAELDRQALRAESEAATGDASPMAQARLQIEAVEAGDEAARALKQPAQDPGEDAAGIEAALVNWRERLESEMALAQAQWNELLQSSLDSGM